MPNNKNTDIDALKTIALKNNAKVDKINTEQIRQEEQRRSAQNRLKQALDSFCKTYNVALKANSIDELLTFFEKRAEVRGAELQAEIDKQNKAIELYESGNIAAMNRLMGVSNNTKTFGYDNTDILGEMEEDDTNPVPAPKKAVVTKSKPVEEVEEVEEECEVDETTFNQTGVDCSDMFDDDDFDNDESEWLF